MKNLYLFIFILSGFGAIAQNPIPNGGFEQWTSGTYESPQYYNNSNPGTFFKCFTPFNCIKTTDAYHGAYALQLTTTVGVDTCIGYVLNANSANGNPCSWLGGIPYNQTPAGLSGYYKPSLVPGDSAGLLVAFKLGGSCLGLYLMKFGGTSSTYLPFNLTFSPPLPFTPDTMVFAAVSSDVFNNVQMNGSSVKFDSLTFTGGVPQPAQFNGDFENWQSVTIDKPNNWYMQTDDQGSGILKTTDVYAGSYAMELKTFVASKNNGSLSANGAKISTGYYDNSCNCQRGGYPFSNTTDTLAFYYKYLPSANDSAEVSINLRANSVNIGGRVKNIGASASYLYMEIPVSAFSTPDTVIVDFGSSVYSDSALVYSGSDLKIDEIHFKSQNTTGIANYNSASPISIFPNPSADGSITVSNIRPFDLVKVYNVYGQEVNAQVIKAGTTAQIKIHSSGAYFVKINSSGKVTTQRVIININ